MTDLYFQHNPTYRAAQPGLQRWAVFCWMTALSGTKWMLDPNVKTPWQAKLGAGLWGWALFGLFPLFVIWFAVWVIWLSVRMCLLAPAILFSTAYWLGPRRELAV